MTNPESEQTPTQLKRQELESLSDSELDERYIAVFATKGPDLEREDVINQIIYNSPAPGAPTLAVVEDKEDGSRKVKDANGKEHKITADMKGLVVLRQVVVDTLNGGMVEVPNTEQIQTYTKEKFDELNRNNFFTESKMKIEVLQKA